MSASRALANGCLTAATATAVPYLCLKSFRFAAAAQYRWGLVGASAAFSVVIFLLVLVFDVGVQRVRARSSGRRVAIRILMPATRFCAKTASLLMRSVRAEDFVCRYGGEEFVVVLPTSDLRASESRAQRIREKLRDLVVMDHGRSLGVITASIGVAALSDQCTHEKELLQAADAALYRAKREGA